MRKNLLCHVLTFLIVFTAFVRLQAQQKDTLLGYENFVTEPRPLHKLQGGLGWNGGWYVQNVDSTTPGYQVVDTARLAYPGLKVTGNYALGGKLYLTAGRTFDVSESGPFKDYLKVIEDRRFVGKEDSTLWVSYLVKMNSSNPDALQISLVSGDYLDSRRTLAGFGYYGDSSKVNNAAVWTLKVDTNYYRTSKPIVAGETVLALMRIKFSVVDTISLYINPTKAQILSGIVPAAYSAQGITGKNLGIQSLSALLGNNVKTGSFDEFRIGNTFKSVLPSADTIRPIVPVVVDVEPISGTSAVVTWEEGTDNDTVWGYYVFSDKVIIDTIYGAERVDTIVGLTPGNTYAFGIAAFDASGNISEDTSYTAIDMPIVTGVAQANSGQGIVFFPNPAQQKISYKLSQNIGQGKVSIIDQLGSVIFTRETDGIVDGSIDISSLTAGSYLVVVETEKLSFHQLLLKQ